jgi:hypothetical protein
MNQKYFCALAGMRSLEIRRRTDLISSASLFQFGTVTRDVLSKRFDTSSHPNQKRSIVVARFRVVRWQIRRDVLAQRRTNRNDYPLRLIRLLRAINEASN